MCQLGRVSRAGLCRFDVEGERPDGDLDLRNEIQRIALESAGTELTLPAPEEEIALIGQANDLGEEQLTAASTHHASRLRDKFSPARRTYLKARYSIDCLDLPRKAFRSARITGAARRPL